MRVATAHDTQSSIDSIAERREVMSRLQQQVSTGRRVVEPKDDPLAAANAERMRSSLARIEIEKRTIGYARLVLGQADGALADSTATVQSARELLLSATSPIQTPAERTAIAQQLRGMRDQLLSVANRSDGAGNYIFGGQGASTAPFVGTDAIAFQAQSGERNIGQELRYTVSQDGNATFTQVSSESGPPVNLFDQLMAVIRVLELPASSANAIRDAANATIGAIDTGIASMSLRRTQIGEQLRQIDEHETSLSARDEQDRKYLSDLIDIDLAVAISDLSAHQLSLDASIKTYQMMSRINLFDRL